MTSLVTTDLLKAAQVLASGHVCAIPTETVYGLAADANNLTAINRVFEAKGRPSDHPLIVHVASFADANNWLVDLPDWAQKLATNFWPGPLTLVGKRASHVLDAVTGGQDTVAVRVPAHLVARELLELLKEHGVNGLVAPSANKFGHVSPTSSAHVEADLGDYLLENEDLILEGGSSHVGLESTIVLVTGDSPVVLRPGAITQSDIENATGLKVISNLENKPRVSGSLDSHYAPKAKVILVSQDQIPNEDNAGFIGLTQNDLPGNLTVLLAAKNLEDYAANLYQALRAGDLAGLAKIYAVLPTGDGLAEAICDRLTRAAH